MVRISSSRVSQYASDEDGTRRKDEVVEFSLTLSKKVPGDKQLSARFTLHLAQLCNTKAHYSVPGLSSVSPTFHDDPLCHSSYSPSLQYGSTIVANRHND